MQANNRERVRLGAASIGNLYRAMSDAAAQATLDAAWAAGLTRLDTAPLYGHGRSEERVGRDIRAGRAWTVSTKVGRTLVAGPPGHHGFVDPLPHAPVFDFSRDAVLRTFDASLARLGVDRVETLLLHDIGEVVQGARHAEVLRQAFDEALPAMAELKAAGRVARIGLGVNETAVVDAVLDHTDLDAVLIAGRYTLLEQSALATFDRCAARGVTVLAAGVFNSGLLAGGTTYNYAAVPPKVAARAAALGTACARHGVALAAAALALPLAHPAVGEIVVGIGEARHVDAMVKWLGQPIPPALWADLRQLGLLAPDVPLPC